MQNELFFSKQWKNRGQQYHAPFGTLVCYNGESALCFDIVDDKNGSSYFLCEDFPYLSFFGNIIEGTEKPKSVVKFIKFHGEDITIEEVQEQVSDFKNAKGGEYVVQDGLLIVEK